MAYAALSVTQIRSMPRGTGTEITIEIPEAAAPVRFDFAHATLSTRRLVVWMRDPAQIQTPDTPTIELFGVFVGALTGPLRRKEAAMVQLETWFEEHSLADLIEGSEFLAKRGLRFTVEGKMGTVVPG